MLMRLNSILISLSCIILNLGINRVQTLHIRSPTHLRMGWQGSAASPKIKYDFIKND